MMPAKFKVERRGWKMRAVTVSHHITWQLGKRFPNTVPLVFVLGYWKSGTTWATQLTADYLQLPFPKLSMLPIGCPAVVHGHEWVTPDYPHCVYIVRDGRDALVSGMFHTLRRIQSKNGRRTRAEAKMFPDLEAPEPIRANIQAFIEHTQSRTNYTSGSWASHVKSYQQHAQRDRLCMLQYEKLVSPLAPEHFAQAMAKLTGDEADMDRVVQTIDKFSFKKQSGRESGIEDKASFLRKGKAGDWVNHFTPKAAEMFDQYCGQTLIEMGYEQDNSWTRLAHD